MFKHLPNIDQHVEIATNYNLISKYKKGHRIIINTGTKRKPVYFVGTVELVKPKDNTVKMKFDSGASDIIDVTNTTVGVLGRSKKETKRQKPIEAKDLHLWLIPHSDATAKLVPKVDEDTPTKPNVVKVPITRKTTKPSASLTKGMSVIINTGKGGSPLYMTGLILKVGSKTTKDKDKGTIRSYHILRADGVTQEYPDNGTKFGLLGLNMKPARANKNIAKGSLKQWLQPTSKAAADIVGVLYLGSTSTGKGTTRKVLPKVDSKEYESEGLKVSKAKPKSHKKIDVPASENAPNVSNKSTSIKVEAPSNHVVGPTKQMLTILSKQYSTLLSLELEKTFILKYTKESLSEVDKLIVEAKKKLDLIKSKIKSPKDESRVMNEVRQSGAYSREQRLHEKYKDKINI